MTLQISKLRCKDLQLFNGISSGLKTNRVPLRPRATIATPLQVQILNGAPTGYTNQFFFISIYLSSQKALHIYELCVMKDLQPPIWVSSGLKTSRVLQACPLGLARLLPRFISV